MAQKGAQREKISCSICLDSSKDPVTIPCGHSYCMNCIKGFWDEEDQKKIHSCPQCRKKFIQRPVSVKNIMLAELVEESKKTGLQTAPADHCYAGPEDVACDVCTGRKSKAVRSCLNCPASYCENHLQPHYDAPGLKKHKSVNPSKKLQENICALHDEVMTIFCRTDQKCICYLCSMDEHKGHKTILAATERAEKQRELQASRERIQRKIQKQEKEVKQLQENVEDINASADKAVEDSEKIFTESIRLLQERSSDVKQQIRSQQETEVSSVKELQKESEQEITDSKWKDAEMEQLSNTEDHNQFLHNYASSSAVSESTNSPSIYLYPCIKFEEVTSAVSKLRAKIQDISSEPIPKTRDEFLKYSQEITSDPKTANRKLLLSEGNKKATRMKKTESYPDHPDRFTGYTQVSSRESSTGRCYWEVEWKGERVYVAVSYKNISRAGSSEECEFGFNKNSWSLECNNGSYTFYHNRVETKVAGPVSSRIGVYSDHKVGISSFYSVSKTMTLLHRVHTTFTQPLHAGIWLFNLDSTAEFIKVK